MKGGKHVLHTSSFSRVHIQPCDAQALKDDSLHTLTHEDEEGNVWSPENILTDWSWSARTLTWKHYLANKQRCWFQWSPCCPRSWCRRPGCRGSRRRPDKRWSGTPPARQADLETITPHKDETVSANTSVIIPEHDLYLTASFHVGHQFAQADWNLDQKVPPLWNFLCAQSNQTALSNPTSVWLLPKIYLGRPKMSLIWSGRNDDNTTVQRLKREMIIAEKTW